MSDEFIKRARMAAHDLQGRVEAGKLAMFDQTIDRLGEKIHEVRRLREIAKGGLQDRLRPLQEAQRATTSWGAAYAARQEEINGITSAIRWIEKLEAEDDSR